MLITNKLIELNNLRFNFRYIGGNLPAKLDTVLQLNVWNIKILLNSTIWKFFFNLYFGRNPNFVWNNDRDIAMCGETLVEGPYRFKMRSTEREQAWESIAENLNAMPSLKFNDSAVCAWPV